MCALKLKGCCCSLQQNRRETERESSRGAKGLCCCPDPADKRLVLEGWGSSEGLVCQARCEPVHFPFSVT